MLEFNLKELILHTYFLKYTIFSMATGDIN